MKNLKRLLAQYKGVLNDIRIAYIERITEFDVLNADFGYITVVNRNSSDNKQISIKL